MYRPIFFTLAFMVIGSASAPVAVEGQTINIYNDRNQQFKIAITGQNRNSAVAQVAAFRTARLPLRGGPYDMTFTPNRGNTIYCYGVEQDRLNENMNLSEVITEVGRTRDGRPIYQHMEDNGFYPSEQDQQFLDELKNSSWWVTYDWKGPRKPVELEFDGGQGRGGDYRLTNVQYVASDSFYIVGRCESRNNGAGDFVLEIPRSQPDRFSGGGTGHGGYSFSGRRLR